jgi:hypothetical protein
MGFILPRAASRRFLFLFGGRFLTFALAAAFLNLCPALRFDLPAAPLDLTGPVTTVTASPGANVVILDALDPNVSGLVSTNVFLIGGGPTPSDTTAVGGFAAWSSGSRVYFYVYDAFRRLWVGTNANTGSTFDLRNTNGVIAWTSGATAHYAAYNWTRSVWVKDSQPIGSAALTLDVTDGIASGSTGAGVFYAAFDPRAGVWKKDSAATGVPGEFRNAQGIVAWSAGNFVFGRAYDPRSASWKDYNLNAGGTTFDLRNSGGVLAWTRNPFVGYAIFDSPRGVWQREEVNVGFATDLVVSNSTVYWKTTVAHRRGYRPSQGWVANVTGVEASFLASTNAVAAPVSVLLMDLSLGGSSWSWNFGGGLGTPTRRSPLVRFPAFGQFAVTQTVTGDGGLASTNLLIVTDVTPPTGTVQINNGDEFATNPSVTLQLAATDSSGAALSMRFSNDNTNSWSAWEPFAATKSWVLSAGPGLKTVFAQFRDAGGNSSAIVSDSITLDDTPAPVIAIVSTNVLESAGNIILRAVLDRAVNRTVSARYVTSNGTAADGEDYTRQEGLLVFAPNVTAATVTVPILADAAVEPNETFFLNLSSPTNATTGEPGTVTIVDDDNAAVSFLAPNFNVAEDSGQASVVVRLNSASGQTVSVRVIAQGGTASSGQDFVATNAVLVFLPGQTNRTLSFPVLDDLLDELTETVSLSLTNLTNAVMGIPSQATVSILDNDQPILSFGAEVYSGFEDDFSIPVQVRLSKPYSQQVSANFTIFGGTATPGVDYTILGTLIFPANTTNATVTIFPINDASREPDETIRLRLTDIAGASPGLTETTVTVKDEDGAPRFLTVGVTNAQLRAVLRGRADQPFDLEATSDLQAWTFFRRLTNSPAGTAELSVPVTDPPRYLRAVVP